MKDLGSKTLETNRLILRKTEEEDLKKIWEILLIEEVSRYYLTSKINKNWEDEKKWQYKKLERADNKDVYCWTIFLKEEKKVIGQITVQESKELNKEIRDIGWFLSPFYQKKGFAEEAATEVLKYMFLEVEIEKIKTCCACINSSSWILMERLGFKRLNSTHFEKYTLLEEPQKVYEYECSKTDFLQELFRKQKLYIEEDIDKEPYQKQISEDSIWNITGESGSGKSTFIELYHNLDTVIIIDTDLLYQNTPKELLELKKYIQKKYQKLPDICLDFDKVYESILEFYQNQEKWIIIDSAQFRNLKDLSLLKGEIIILRTCVNTCYNRCIERFQKNHPQASLEELGEYSNKKKNIYKWYHSLNSFINRIDKLRKEE